MLLYKPSNKTICIQSIALICSGNGKRECERSLKLSLFGFSCLPQDQKTDRVMVSSHFLHSIELKKRTQRLNEP